MDEEHEVLKVLKDTGILKGIADSVDSEIIKKNYKLKCELLVERHKHGLGYDAYKKILRSVRNKECFYMSNSIMNPKYVVVDYESFNELMEDRKKLKKIKETE